MADQQQHRILERRKARHAALNTFIDEHGGWLVSIPGAPVMRFEAAPGSSLPEDLRGKGYVVTPVGDTMRVTPNAGIVQTEVFELALPPGALL